METKRPLDFLGQKKGKSVLVITSKSTFQGILISFDLNLNLVINDATIGEIFIRGDKVHTVN